MVVGARTWARSVAQAWTSDGRTAASRREPSGVASTWRRTRLACGSAVLARCGRVAR